MDIRQAARCRLDSLSASRRRSVTRLRGAWRRFADHPERASDDCLADILLLPLAGLTFSLFVLSLPGASDAIAAACSMVCMP
jgi:hypothetical protein